jgi:hypothetical protein
VTLDANLQPRHEKNRIGVCAHHVWTMQGERWTCSSLGGTIEFDKLANDPGYRMPFVFEVRLMEVRDEALGSNGILNFGNIDRHLHLLRTFSPSATGQFSGR